MINLLPPKIKKEQKIKQLSSQVSAALFALMVMVILTYSAIYLVNYFLASQLQKSNQLLDDTNIEIASLKPLEDSVNSINSKISKLDTFDKQSIEWSTFLKNFNASIPANVTVTSIQADANQKSFSVTAAAETRADIVKLQGKLEDMDLLKNLSFQNSVFEEKNNYYTFTIIGSLE